MKFPFFSKKKDSYVLVISGGGMRGFYGLGIIKAIEELGLKDRISAICGVSAGGLLASYWAAGYDADNILKAFLNSEFLDLKKNFNFIPKNSILTNAVLKKQILKDLPKTFEELKLPIYLVCTDVQIGQSTIISSGDLASALMGTIAIPGIFPAVKRGNEVLIDGGVTNNFPINFAKSKFPKNKIIGISLNKYRKNPKIGNLLDNLVVSFQIMLRKDIESHGAMADVFFCRALDVSVLEMDVKKLKNIFNLGYRDGLEKLKEIL